MVGLDTFIEKRITKWLDAARTVEELKSRATIFMWSVFTYHLLLAISTGWWLYRTMKKKEKTTMDLIVPIIFFCLATIVPSGTEEGEELTGVPSSVFLGAITVILSIITLVVWFRKKEASSEKIENKEESL